MQPALQQHQKTLLKLQEEYEQESLTKKKRPDSVEPLERPASSLPDLPDDLKERQVFSICSNIDKHDA